MIAFKGSVEIDLHEPVSSRRQQVHLYTIGTGVDVIGGAVLCGLGEIVDFEEEDIAGTRLLAAVTTKKPPIKMRIVIITRSVLVLN